MRRSGRQAPHPRATPLHVRHEPSPALFTWNSAGCSCLRPAAVARIIQHARAPQLRASRVPASPRAHAPAHGRGRPARGDARRRRQAMITGTFSIVRQSISLGCFPRVTVKHTSAGVEGARAGRRPDPGGGRRREARLPWLFGSPQAVSRGGWQRLPRPAPLAARPRAAASSRGSAPLPAPGLTQRAPHARGPDCRRLA